jgi:hypothetical protein
VEPISKKSDRAPGFLSRFYEKQKGIRLQSGKWSVREKRNTTEIAGKIFSSSFFA